MGEAIGQILPLAVVVGLSPIPIIAVVLVLATPRGRASGTAFVAGWLVGLAVVGVVTLAIADPAGASGDGGPSRGVGILELVLGVAVLLMALREWRRRPRGDEEPPMPKWMGALDRVGPPRALGMGVLLSAPNPKNLLLSVAAAAAIAGEGLSAGQEAIAYAVFAVIGTLGVGVPLVLTLALGDRSRHILDGLRGWMARNNAVIMAVLCLVIGAKLVGDGISGLSA